MTGPQMVLVMKLTTFAWNVWDGRRPVEVRAFLLQPQSPEPTDRAQRTCLGSRQVADEDAGHQIPLVARIFRLLVRHPLMCFLSDRRLTIICLHRLYFPGVLVGPYLEYATYSSLVNGTLVDEAAGGGPEACRPIRNGRKRTAYRKMLFALGYLGIYMGVAPKISFHTAVTDWFLEQSLPYRFVGSVSS